ncbi:MAG TPA: S8 family serine peptidase [Streptosporangiaceae bacterium]|nr:S8 family serine peptidase [Streptosporangiaceae bacterium]
MRYTRALRAAPIVVPALLVAVGTTAQAQTVAGQAAGSSSRAQSAPSGWRPLTPAQAKALSRNVSDKVIVVLRRQFPGLPDTAANSARRAAAVSAAQASVISDLRATHASNVHSISLVNAVAATVSTGEAKRLRSSPAVAGVVKDLPIPLLPSISIPRPARPGKSDAGIKPLPGACPATKKGVQLDPEAVEAIHAAAQSGKTSAQGLGYTGAGVKVAYIADGIDPNNQDFIRANGKHVFIDNEDFSGTGTSAPTNGGEAFLDASSIAAQGRHVYDISTYGGPLSVPCRIRILGVAPGASLIGLNVFGSSNLAFNSVFLEAISYAVSHDRVNVLNESFGSNPFPDVASLDLTKMANDAAIKAGVTVTVSSGDAGITNTIGSPASDPAVISAGASTTYRSYAQTGVGGIFTPGIKGWISNNISGLSSGGFTQNAGTVDVVAPGDLNWALCTAKPKLFSACTNFANKPAAVELEGGTSEAAPLTAGVAALVIQAYAKAHHGHHPSPAIVKRIIVSTAQDVSAPAEQQGAGLIDAYQAVLAARSFKAKTKAGHAVLDSATQFTGVDQLDTDQHFSETLTNDGTGSVTLHLSSRTLSPYSQITSKSLTLNAAQGFESIQTFTVDPGQARLNVAIALHGAVDLSLISPSGKFAEFNLPQGFGNYGDAQVARPQAGKWTALIAGIPSTNGKTAKASFLAQEATWQPFGHLSTNTLTLASGASGSFSLDVSTPASPGDAAGSIVVTSSAGTPAFAKVTTIPVTLRGLVPTPAPLQHTVTFSGTLTGGNGRAPNAGQTAYYQLDAPAFDTPPALNADISTGNANNTMFAELVSPDGEVVSASDNAILATNAGGGFAQLVQQQGLQLHVLAPEPGRWTLIIDFYNSVSGTAATQPFSVTLDDQRVNAASAGLPDSFTTIPAGDEAAASITVTNGGTSPEEYFVDPRLDKNVVVKLAAQTTSTLQLPNLFGVVPLYLVPSQTSSVTATVTAKVAQFFDLQYPFGDPDLNSSTGKTSKVTFAPPGEQVPNGDYSVTPFLKGPDGAKGSKTVTARVSMTATMAQIDRNVSSGTGDLWSGSTNVNAAFTPVIVQPGQTVTIPLTIFVKGTAGTKVSGTISLEDVSFNSGLVTANELFGNFPTSSTVASFNYSYTVGS